MTVLITVDPDPPKAGEDLKICYPDPGTPSITLDIDWTPAGLHPPTVTISFPPGCATISVPATATEIEIVDPTGGSDPYTSAVTPA